MAINGSRSDFTAINNYTLDTFTEMFNLSASEVALVNEWKALKSKYNRTTEDNNRLIELNNLLVGKLVTSEDWNKLLDAMYNLEKAYLDKGLDRIEALETVIDNLTSISSTNPLSAKQGKVLNDKIDSTKTSIMSDITNKITSLKNNEIQTISDGLNDINDELEGDVSNNIEGIKNKFLVIADKTLDLSNIDECLPAGVANVGYMTLDKGTYIVNAQLACQFSESHNKLLTMPIAVFISDSSTSITSYGKSCRGTITVRYNSADTLNYASMSLYTTFLRVENNNTKIYLNTYVDKEYVVYCPSFYAFKLSDSSKMVKTQNGVKYYYDF